MNPQQMISLSVLIGLATLGFYLLIKGYSRSSRDVVDDLRDEPKDKSIKAQHNMPGGIELLRDSYGIIGLFSLEERRLFDLEQMLIPIAAAFLFACGRITFFSSEPSGVIASAILGLALGVIISKARYRRRCAAYVRSIEFFLPIVMERVVMAVQAGLDIVPAISALIELDRGRGESKDSSVALDPVTRLLRTVLELSEAGVRFEEALKEVAGVIKCGALKHAFIHLAVAHREGGELITPLRELSDSTQLYYQETIEEEIAKLPVKATMPLLLTFAGLIVFFLTTPMVQVIETVLKAAPK